MSKQLKRSLASSKITFLRGLRGALAQEEHLNVPFLEISVDGAQCVLHNVFNDLYPSPSALQPTYFISSEHH